MTEENTQYYNKLSIACHGKVTERMYSVSYCYSKISDQTSTSICFLGSKVVESSRSDTDLDHAKLEIAHFGSECPAFDSILCLWFKPTVRDSVNNFCRFSFLGYQKRNDSVPSCSQQKLQETTGMQPHICILKHAATTSLR